MTNLMSERARRLRREKGAAERKLWYLLRDFNRHGFHFRQQAPIGAYIADFCDHTAKLIVEVDGAQHGEPRGLANDRRRTRWMESQGYNILRFWNGEVLRNMYGVEVAIKLALGIVQECTPVDANGPRIPSPLVGEGKGGGDSRTSAVGLPPTPNPSPQGGGESAQRQRNASEPHHG
ncbi:MAG: endonuclease domain-containing protein [Hyphomicrobiaceae bacterium]